MVTELQEKLTDWAAWSVYNRDRLTVYYGMREVLPVRYTFLVKCLDGLYHLMAMAVEDMQHQWDFQLGHDMPLSVAKQLQEDVAWFYRHKDTITDMDTKYEFLMQAYAKGLQGLKAVAEELDRLAGRPQDLEPIGVDDDG